MSKNVHFDKLNDIVNKYNKKYHDTIKMKPVNVKSDIYLESSKEINNKDPKFKIDDIFRVSKNKNIFAEGYTPDQSEEVLVKKELKMLCSGHVINDLNGEEIFTSFLRKRIARNESK